MKLSYKMAMRFLFIVLSFAVICPPLAFAQEINVGTFTIEMDLKDLGKSPSSLTPDRADRTSPLPHILAEKHIVSQAQVFLTEEEHLRLAFRTPILIHLTDRTTDSSIERLIPQIQIELSPRQRQHFITMFMSANADLVATTDIIEQELDMSRFRDLERINPKDYADGRAFYLPVISKPLKILQLPFLQLQDVLSPGARIERINIDIPALEVVQIRSPHFELITGELRTLTLVETMEGVLSRAPEIQKLVELRTQAHIGREQSLEQIRRNISRPQIQEPSPRPAAQILSFSHARPGLRCRNYLKDSGSASTTGSGQVIAFPFGQ